MNKQKELQGVDGGDILSAFMFKHGYRFEGEQGLDRLSKLITDLGYKPSNLQWGSAIEMFLEDNYDAMQVLLNFIVDAIDVNHEWKQAMINKYSKELLELGKDNDNDC